MKNLLFIVVAVFIFSGISISLKAQTSVNALHFTDLITQNNSLKFIDGVEIKPSINKSFLAKNATKDESNLNIENCSILQFKYAQLMNVEVEMVKNLDFFNVIEEWWATRYRYGGTSKKGIDCSAYTGTLYKETYNIILPRTAREQYRVCEKIEREDLEEGDLVFFNTRGGVSHVGVYVGNNCFTHSSVHSGVTISSLNDPYYSKKFIKGGRPIEVSETK